MATDSFLPYLPTELRLQIWDDVVRSDLDQPHMAIIEIEPDDETNLFWQTEGGQADSVAEHLRLSDPIFNVVRGRSSTLLDTCCETREVVERSLKRLSVSRHQHLLGPNDTLLLLPQPDLSGELENSLRVPVAPYFLLKRLEVKSIAVLLHKESWTTWDTPDFWQSIPDCVKEIILLEVGGPVREFTPAVSDLQSLTTYRNAGRFRDTFFLDHLKDTVLKTTDTWEFIVPTNAHEYWYPISYRDSIPLLDNHICPKLKYGRDAGETFSWFDETLRRLRAMEQASLLEKSSSRVVRYVLMPGDPFRDVKFPGQFRFR